MKVFSTSVSDRGEEKKCKSWVVSPEKGHDKVFLPRMGPTVTGGTTIFISSSQSWGANGGR